MSESDDLLEVNQIVSFDPITLEHPGLSIDQLSKFKSHDSLPVPLCKEIDKILADINDDNRFLEIGNLLAELINIVIGYQPKNFIEYRWYIQFTCAFLLLKDIPDELYTKRSQLVEHTFQLPSAPLDICPVKMHIFTKMLFNLVGNDYNLAYLIREIFDLNRLSRYVCTSLLWAAMRRYVNEENELFRMYKIENVMSILMKIKLDRMEENMKDLHRFLTLLTLFMNVVVLREQRELEYKCFRGFFNCEKNDVALIINWLENVKRKADRILTKTKNNADCLQIIEIIDIDVLNSFRKQASDETNNYDFEL